MSAFKDFSNCKIVLQKLLLLTLCFSLAFGRPTSRVYFDGFEGDRGQSRRDTLIKREQIFEVDRDEYRSRVGETAGDILFPTDEERDEEVRSRLIATPSESLVDFLEASPVSETENFLPPSTPLGDPENSEDNSQDSAESLLDSFLEWADDQGVPENVIKTFRTTNKFGEQAKPREEGGVGWSLTIGTKLQCGSDEVKGQDGVCRPRVMFK